MLQYFISEFGKEPRKDSAALDFVVYTNSALGVTTERRSRHKYAAGWVISYNPSWKQLSVTGTGTEYIAYWIKIFCKPELQ